MLSESTNMKKKVRNAGSSIHSCRLSSFFFFGAAASSVSGAMAPPPPARPRAAAGGAYLAASLTGEAPAPG